MTGPPGGVPPPEKEAAAQAGTGAAGNGSTQSKQYDQFTTNVLDYLAEKAFAVARDGELHRFLPEKPQWYRRTGGRVLQHLAARLTEPAELPSLDRKRLEFVHDLAKARRRGTELGPEHPAPLHATLEEARAALSAAFDDIAAATLAYHNANKRIAA